MMPASSTLIGRYEVIRELGRGAMGTVFLARDTALGRLVALKTFRAPFGEDSDPEDSGILRRRSLREAQRAGTLSHPSVITIFDVVENPDHDSFHTEFPSHLFDRRPHRPEHPRADDRFCKIEPVASCFTKPSLGKGKQQKGSKWHDANENRRSFDAFSD